MYLIINEDYTIEKSEILTGRVRCLARKGEISLIDTRTMRGMNSAKYQLEGNDEWSEINDYKRSYAEVAMHEIGDAIIDGNKGEDDERD